MLYDTLVERHATVGALVGRAIAHAQGPAGPSHGLRLLDDIAPELVRGYQPWWVARAHVLDMVGRPDEGSRCLERGVGLTSHPRVRQFLLERIRRIKDRCGGEASDRPNE